MVAPLVDLTAAIKANQSSHQMKVDVTRREKYRKITIGNAIADTIVQVRITSSLRDGTGKPLHTISWKIEAVAIKVQFKCADQARGLRDS